MEQEKNRTVLLALGEAELLARLGRLLRRENWSVLAETTSGVTALSLALSGAPELVILDPVLNGLNGLEVLRRLKEQRCRAKIMLLGGFSHRLAQEGLRLGADAVVLTPVTDECLLRRVWELLETQTP